LLRIGWVGEDGKGGAGEKEGEEGRGLKAEVKKMIPQLISMSIFKTIYTSRRKKIMEKVNIGDVFKDLRTGITYRVVHIDSGSVYFHNGKDIGYVQLKYSRQWEKVNN